MKNDKNCSVFRSGIEAFISSFSILITGVFTIPLVYDISKFIGGNTNEAVEISTIEALRMSILFAIGRFVWYFIIRLNFDRIWGKMRGY